MLTVRTATALLTRSDAAAALHELLGELGFRGPPLPLGDDLRATLAPEGRVTAGSILTGPGALRACALEAADGVDAQQTVAGTARRLAQNAPHALWLVAASQRTPARTIIAAPQASRGTRAIPALVVDRIRVVDSDAETVAALAAARAGDGVDLAVHARWVEVLGREGLNRRFYRTLEQRVSDLAGRGRGGRSADDRAEVALLCSSRLLFLAFLQARGWLDGDRAFLSRTFDECMATGGSFDRRMLRPLFFGTLNTPVRQRAPATRAFGRLPFLNGGLFAPAGAERGARRPELADDALGAFIADLLERYRFTAREDQGTLSEAAVDPEMLGRAFESLMASRERRASGTFYTPSALVARVADAGLAAAVERMLPSRSRRAVASLLADEQPAAHLRTDARAALAGMRVLDPACGSGAFLIHALDRLSRWTTLAGDDRPPDAIRRELLARSIFGVDRNPTAVWLCELRLWLAMAVECVETDPMRVAPLPNLDRNIRVGDALSRPVGWSGDDAVRGAAIAGPRTFDGARLAALRDRYSRAAGVRKVAAARALDLSERRAAISGVERELVIVRERRRDLIAARRSRDLFGERVDGAGLVREAAMLRTRSAELRRERRRLADGGALPFRYDVQFADVMAAGGFTAVIGNPPWVRLHRIAPAARALLRERYRVLREAMWEPGVARSGAGGGFASQADLAALFVEQSLVLLCERGVMSLLVPAKLWTNLAGGGVRRLLSARAQLLSLEDCTGARELFDAVTYPSVVVAERTAVPDARVQATVAVHRGEHLAHWDSLAAGIAFDGSPGSPWLTLPPAARAAFDRLRAAGPALGDTAFGRPLMGVKCGRNDAYLVSMIEGGEELASIQDRSGRQGRIERELLRPVLRGEDVRAWSALQATEHIVWTHDDRGPLHRLPAHAQRWLAPHRARLAARTDARGRLPWWALFRTDAAGCDVPRVVWADMAREPRASWLAAGDPTVPLNTCYVLRCPTLDDAHAMTALLNSPLAAAWLRAIAEPARGGYRRLFAWTMALLPIPHDWPRARAALAPLAAHARDEPASPAAVLDAVLAAYGVRGRDMEALLEWTAH